MAGCSHFVHPPEMLTHWGPDSTAEARTDLPQVPGTSPLHVASGLWAGPASLARQLGDYSRHFTESSRPLANLFTEAPQTGRGLANKASPGIFKVALKGPSAFVYSRPPGLRWLAGVRGFHPHGTRWPPRKPPASQHCISLKQRNLISLNQSLDKSYRQKTAEAGPVKMFSSQQAIFTSSSTTWAAGVPMRQRGR